MDQSKRVLGSSRVVVVVVEDHDQPATFWEKQKYMGHLPVKKKTTKTHSGDVSTADAFWTSH